jgi:protein-S-isoprenylcysteine O-methyltransferase Ste14
MISAANPSRDLNFAQGVDVFERVLALGLFFLFCSRMADKIWLDEEYIYALVLAVEIFVLYFMLFRRLACNVSTLPRDWVVAVLGTCLPMLVVPAVHEPIAPAFFCGLLIVLGFTIQFYGKLTLNRNFGIVAANRGVKTKGPYILVRHPIYLGYILSHTGFLLYAPHWWNAIVYISGFAFQVLRILAEERLLSADVLYREYTAKVPYRLVPGLF